jgi:hypothetical protein
VDINHSGLTLGSYCAQPNTRAPRGPLPLRLPSPRRIRQPSVAALAIAMGCATGAFAQDASPGALALKNGDGALSATAAPLASNAFPDTTQPEAQKGKQPKKAAPRKSSLLPALQPYPRAQRLGTAGGPPALDPAKVPPPTVAALPPIPARHRPSVEDKPFDPVGIRLGDMKLLPTIEEDLGYATNPSQLSGPVKGSAYETTQAGLGFQSDWARNELNGSLTAGYTDYFATPQANNPNANGVIDGRFDVSHDLSFDSEGRFNVATQTPGSVTLPTGIVLAGNQRPLVETYGASLGGTQKFGDLALSLHGTLDRTDYQNATVAGGGIEDLASDDFTAYGLRARAAYQISPVISPFFETVFDTRHYDSAVDFTGFARNSNGALARAGVTLALSGQLTGEASLGYGERQYQDARLPDLHAPLIDASLIWSVTPLTTITLKTGTTLADTTNSGDSGAVSRSYTIDVSHALLRNLTLGANAGYATDVYSGAPLHDETTSFGAHADYNVTRDIVLRASAAHSQFTSSAPDSSYIANVFMLGLRLQR